MKRALLITIVGVVLWAGQMAEAFSIVVKDGPTSEGWIADGTASVTTSEWGVRVGNVKVFVPYSAPVNLERLGAFEKLLPESLNEEELQFLIKVHYFETTQYPVFAKWTPAYQPVYPYIYELLNSQFSRQPFGEYVLWHMDVLTRSFDARSRQASFERVRKILSDALPEYKDSPAFDDGCGSGSLEDIRGLRLHMWQAIDSVGSASLTKQAIALEEKLKGERPDDPLPELKGPGGIGLDNKVWKVLRTKKRRLTGPITLSAPTRLLDLLAEMVLHETNQDSKAFWSDSDNWKDWVSAMGPDPADDVELQFVPVYGRLYQLVTEGLINSPAKSVRWHITILEKCGDPQLRQRSWLYLDQVLSKEAVRLLPDFWAVKSGRVAVETIEEIRQVSSQHLKDKVITEAEISRHRGAVHSSWDLEYIQHRVIR